MNEVFITGIAVSTPVRLDRSMDVPHIRFQLLVPHKDRQGRMWYELLTVNASKRLALWALSNIAPMRSITVIGYLTRRYAASSVLVEITASRFFIDCDVQYADCEQKNPFWPPSFK